jgi:RNA polymerase sigma-70 factor, ECF subfamily
MENHPIPAKKRKRPSRAQVTVDNGSPDFAEFYRLHDRGLRRLAAYRTHDRADAEDLLQETLERALRAFGRFQPGTNGMAWLGTIMNRLFIDSCRRSRRFVPNRGGAEDWLMAEPACEPDAWWLSLTLDDVREATAELSEQSRALFESAVLHGHSYKEIAARTGLRSVTVGTRLHRIRLKVRTALMRRGPSPDRGPA